MLNCPFTLSDMDCNMLEMESFFELSHRCRLFCPKSNSTQICGSSLLWLVLESKSVPAEKFNFYYRNLASTKTSIYQTPFSKTIKFIANCSKTSQKNHTQILISIKLNQFSVRAEIAFYNGGWVNCYFRS